MPEVGDSEVLIKVSHGSICNTDVPFLTGKKWPLDSQEKIVLCHEFAGKVVALGKDAPKELLGEMVVGEEHYPCLHCDSCRNGHYDMCADDGFLGWYPSKHPDDKVRPAGFAEYVAIHHSCAKLTQGIESNSLEYPLHPSLAEPFGNSVKMASVIKRNQGIPDSMVIYGGAGYQATNMIPLFVSKGVKNFTIVDRDKDGMEFIKNFVKDLPANFNFVYDADKIEQKFDASIELTGAPILDCVAKNAAADGSIYLYGFPSRPEHRQIVPGTQTYREDLIKRKDKIIIDGLTWQGVMGRDNQSWKDSIDVLKNNPMIRKKLMSSVVDAGDDIAGLIEYLNKNGTRYNGLPAKFIWHRGS